MEDIKKTIRYSELVDIYHSLLTKTQSDILIDYFHYDLSLSEIASSRNVSRAAVEDALSKGSKKLDEFEDKLRIYEKRLEILKNTAKLKRNEENSEIIDEIERLVK